MHATDACTAWSLQLCQGQMKLVLTRSNAGRLVAEGHSTAGQYITGTHQARTGQQTSPPNPHLAFEQLKSLAGCPALTPES